MTSLTVASIVLRMTSAFHLTWLVLLIVQKNSGVSFNRPISTTTLKSSLQITVRITSC